MGGIQVEIQEPDFWVIGVTFSVVLTRERKVSSIAGNSSYPSSIWPSKNDCKVGWNPREIGLSSG